MPNGQKYEEWLKSKGRRGRVKNFCMVEEGVSAYRALREGELAVLPNTGHFISPSAVQVSIEFLERHLALQPAPASG